MLRLPTLIYRRHRADRPAPPLANISSAFRDGVAEFVIIPHGVGVELSRAPSGRGEAKWTRRYNEVFAERTPTRNLLMSFTISCPSCQRTLRVPENLLGQFVKCPNCDHTFTVPDRIGEEAPRRPVADQPSRHPADAPPEDDYEDEPHPSEHPPGDDYDDDYDEMPRRRRHREKPGKVQAIAIMILIGGIFACFWDFGWTLLSGFTCCLWPGLYYGLVMGIMAIVKGMGLLSDTAHRFALPQGIALMMIINVINADLVNLTLGILVLVFLADEEVKDFFRG